MDTSIIIDRCNRTIKGTVYDKSGEPLLRLQNVTQNDEDESENGDEPIKTDDRQIIYPETDEDEEEQEDEDEDAKYV